MLPEISGEITPERMKRQSQSKNNTQLVVDVTGDGSKVKQCKQQYCIGTWNVRPMNQGADGKGEYWHLGMSELKWTGMANLTQMIILSTTVGKNPLGEME